MSRIDWGRIISVGQVTGTLLLLACSQPAPTGPGVEGAVPSAVREEDRAPAKNRPDLHVVPVRGEPPKRLAGAWGGEQVSLEAGQNGASFAQYCATGRIDQPVVLDASGRFDVPGTYSRNRGGPINLAEPARFVGLITGNRLTLTVTVLNTNEQIGPFTLELGRPTKIPGCPLV